MTLNVIICDDETTLLKTMTRQIRMIEPRCEVMSYASARDFQTQVPESDADILIMDLHLLDGNGLLLLEQAAVTQPQAMRVLMTGTTEETELLHSLGSCHRFLLKPFEKAEVEDIISSIKFIQSLDLTPQDRILLSETDTLPTKPNVYLKLQQLIKSETQDIDHIARLISEEPSILSRLLAWVNSPIFAFYDKSIDIKTAIVRLGLTRLSQLILIISIQEQVSQLQHPLGTQLINDAKRFTNLCHQYLQSLSVSDSYKNTVLFSAMLSNLGQQIRLMALLKSGQHEITLSDLEQRHVHLATALLRLWGIDTLIVESVQHQYPDSSHLDTSHPAWVLQQCHQMEGA